MPASFERKGRAICFRGGGLGDFILTLPLIDYLIKNYFEVCLVTKTSYFCMVEQSKIKCIDLNLGMNQFEISLDGADVFSFWNDEEWVGELRDKGVKSIYTLCSRPNVPPHMVESLLNIVKPGYFSREFLVTPWLGDRWKKNSTLWIHPGSGSKKKNMPAEFFFDLANQWIKSNDQNNVTFSCGPADELILGQIRSSFFTNHERVKQVKPNSINEFKSLLKGGVSHFWGNDSGPSHLAANLGIPTNVCFRYPNSIIWAPTGPRVKIYDFT